MTVLRDPNFKPSNGIQWPSQLSTPCELIQTVHQQAKVQIVRSPICSKIVLQFIGSCSYLLTRLLNKTQVFNIETFNQELRHLETQVEKLTSDDVEKRKSAFAKRSPFLTFSNHISCIDDPLIWASLLPFSYYAMKTDSVRWSAAAVEICFSKGWHSVFFSLGKTFPVIRGMGLNQPAIDFAASLLKCNQWLHLFPEGRVMRDATGHVLTNEEKGYKFKWGISKLILDFLHSQNPDKTVKGRPKNDDRVIRLLPFYHLGLDEIQPVGRSYIPRVGKRITIYIRPKVIEMNSRLLSDILGNRSISVSLSKSKSNDEIKRIKLTNYLEEEIERLIEPTERMHCSADTNHST